MPSTLSALAVTVLAAISLSAQSVDEWTRVTALPAGTAIRMDTTRSALTSRLVHADESFIVVVVTDNMPRGARRVIAELARDRPGLLLRSGDEYQEGSIRIDRDGLWDGPHCLRSRSELVVRVARSDVVEIRYDPDDGNHAGRAALIGAAAGGAVGYFYGAVMACGAGAVRSECIGIGRMLMLAGAGLGAGIGYALAAHHSAPSGVVYRRPETALTRSIEAMPRIIPDGPGRGVWRP